MRIFDWRKCWVVCVWVLSSLFSLTWAQASPTEQLEKEMQRWTQLSVLMLDSQGQPLVSREAGVARVPASTTKLFTAYLALQHWGELHRFQTAFYLDTSNKQGAVLWVKGSGDPFLVSEELALLTQKLAPILREQGVSSLAEIRLDVSAFKPGVQLPGTGGSDNPYDAIPSALAANFNTLNMRWQKGKWQSAEKQTPLTPLAKQLAQEAKQDIEKNGRINIGQNPKVAQQYFAELLSAFLRQQKIKVVDRVVWQAVPAGQAPIYVHHNSRTLAEVIQPMMKYSTNFIANQLVLMLAAESYQQPASAELVKRLMNETIAELGWQQAYLEDGAGLSRDNRLSTEQLIDLLERFRPWQRLLPQVVPNVYAKSGSLIGVSALVGYIGQGESAKPFALILNQRGPYRYRNQLARLLSQVQESHIDSQ